jgi:hypothetical protein
MKKIFLLLFFVCPVILSQAKFSVTVTPKVVSKNGDTLELLQKSFILTEEGETEIMDLANNGKKKIGIQFISNEVLENGYKVLKIKGVLYNQPKKNYEKYLEINLKLNRRGQKQGNNIKKGPIFFEYGVSVDEYDTYIDRFFEKKKYVQSCDYDIFFRYVQINDAVLKKNKKYNFTNVKEGESSDTLHFGMYGGKVIMAYVTIERNEDFEHHKFNMIIHFITKKDGEWVTILDDSMIALQSMKHDIKKLQTNVEEYKLSYGIIYNVKATKSTAANPDE